MRSSSRLQISQNCNFGQGTFVTNMLVLISTLGTLYGDLVWTWKCKPLLVDYGKMGKKGFGLSDFIIYPFFYEPPFVHGYQSHIVRECFARDTILYMGVIHMNENNHSVYSTFCTNHHSVYRLYIWMKTTVVKVYIEIVSGQIGCAMLVMSNWMHNMESILKY